MSAGADAADASAAAGDAATAGSVTDASVAGVSADFGWGAFEERGTIAFARVLSVSEKVARLEDNRKVPLTHLWARNLPAADAAFLAAVAACAKNTDAAVLWQCANGESLTLDELTARWTATQNANTAATAANKTVRTMAVLQCVFENPVYFARNRKQHIMPRPPDILARALESQKKRQAAEAEEAALLTQLEGDGVPPDILAAADSLLYAPDKNSRQYRTLKRFMKSDGLAFAEYFYRRGIIKEMSDYWRRVFLHKWQPVAEVVFAAPTLVWQPVAVRAFSIDDAGTIEVDDAFSVARLDDGRIKIGVHIAAPAAVLTDEVLSIARRRLTSVYFPDEKHTMLPANVIDVCSLRCGKTRPALSLYFYFDDSGDDGDGGDDNNSGKWSVGETALEQITLSTELTPAMMTAQQAPAEIISDFEIIRKFCAAVEPPKEKAVDYFDFKVTAKPPAVVRRRRDRVAETVEVLMRLTNQVWGGRLAAAQVGGFFRADGMTRTRPPPQHKPYMWLTSPLRRYIDLTNQRLLLSQLTDAPPPRLHWRDTASEFERQYGWAKRCQQLMERHWALVALSRSDAAAVVGEPIGKSRVRLRDYPFYGVCPATRPAQAKQLHFECTEIDFVRQRVHLELL